MDASRRYPPHGDGNADLYAFYGGGERLWTLKEKGSDIMKTIVELTEYVKDKAKLYWEETGDSCYLGILQNDAVLYLAHLDSTHSIKIAGQVGSSYPLACTAPGKVLLAYASSKFRQRYLQECFPDRPEEVARLEEKLAQIRKDGFATDVEEYGRGIICIAAPVFDLKGDVVCTIGISTSTVYCDEPALIAGHGQNVISAAREISEKLGAEISPKGEEK